MKVLVSGYGKGFNYDDVVRGLKETRWDITHLAILTKGSRGIDYSVKKYAIENDIVLWTSEDMSNDEPTLFRLAAKNFIRDVEGVLVFWDGSARRTSDIVNLAKHLGKFVYIYDKEDNDNEDNL